MIYMFVKHCFQVVASERIKQKALDNDIHTALVTEKLDGTCVYIAQFEGNIIIIVIRILMLAFRQICICTSEMDSH